MADTVLRNMIGDFLNVGTSIAEEYVLMGTGFNTLDENPRAQTDTKAYISDASASSVILGYQTQFPFDSDLIKSDKAIQALYDIGRNQKQGADAEMDYVRVELFRELDTPVENKHPARKFRVAVEVSNISGAGAQIVHVAGNLNNVGSFIDGVFDISTKSFAPNSADEGSGS
jgi:hypothetical protein